MKPMAELPYQTSNDLPEGVRAQVIDLLNQLLADAIDLGTQTKQAHWNVKGPHFIALHHLFDEVHGAVEAYADLLAERVVQLGGIAAGTARIAAQHSMLPEYPHAIAAGAEHINARARARAEFGGRVRRAIGETADAGDPDSADICTEISRGVDKWLWFVEAHVQSRSRSPARLTMERTKTAIHRNPRGTAGLVTR
jgi:starvation-inducible DNA-binding protein